MDPIAEAEIKVPPKYVILFIFRDGTQLTLPFKDATRATICIESCTGKYGRVQIESEEPIPSLINLDDLVCATPSKFESE